MHYISKLKLGRDSENTRLFNKQTESYGISKQYYIMQFIINLAYLSNKECLNWLM